MARHAARIVEVSRSIVMEDESELEVLVRCEVSGRWTRATHDDPAESPDVDVIEVVEDAPGNRVRPDLLAQFAADLGVIDDALVQDSDEQYGAWEDEQERRAAALEDRADADREDRMLGQGRYARD